MATPVLAGHHALITGASRGIGRAIAEALAHAGAHVTLVARGASDLQLVADAVAPMGTVVVCDVTSVADVARLAESVAGRTPALDIVVNNAGVFPLAALDVMEPSAFDEAIRANLLAPFYVLRALLPAMKARGTGHIVTIGSIADRHTFPGNGAYAASKYGQRAMHEVLQQELQGTGVRSTLVSPAATDTPIWDSVDPDNTPGFPSRAEMLKPDDVADAVLWAVSRPAHVNIDEMRLSRS